MENVDLSIIGMVKTVLFIWNYALKSSIMLYHNTTHFFWFDKSKEYIASTRRYIHIWNESVPIDMIAMITNDNDNIHVHVNA